MNRLCCPAVVVILLAGFAVREARAQSPATLSGTLLDPSGATIAGAEVSLAPLRPSTAPAALSTKSDPGGHFSFTLPAGQYRLVVSHPSFLRRQEDYTLAAGETRDISLRLELERLSETVVVTAEAQPLGVEAAAAPVQVIAGEEIAARQATSLPVLLSGVTGVSVARSGRIGGITSLFLDGGNSGYTKVLIDGAPVNEPGGAIDLSNYSLDDVAKIEVVHGAESALYGTDAMAGVIQIFTARGTTRKPRLDLLAEGGGFSSARGQATLSGAAGRFDDSSNRPMR